jgi:hypothetical protein
MLSSPIPAPRVVQSHIDQADEMIIKGEERIARLELLSNAMAAQGYDTARIVNLMTEHMKLLQSWVERRSSMIERLQADAVLSVEHTQRL